MPLKPLKENATQEEINEWIIESSQAFNSLEQELEEKKLREKQLEEHNQRLFLKITSNVEDDEIEKQEENEENEIKEYIGENVYKILNKKDLNKLYEILNGDDE